MLELAGNNARDRSINSTGAIHVKMAVSEHEELDTLVSQLGLQAEFDVSDTEFECDLDSCASEFPLFQATMKELLETHAWFSKPEEGRGRCSQILLLE